MIEEYQLIMKNDVWDVVPRPEGKSIVTSKWIYKMKWKIHQMDVKIAFFNGVVEEEVYVEQPLSFETHDRESHVCRLKKALYGLKKAPRTWYARIDSFLSSLGFYLQMDATCIHCDN